MSEQRTAAAGKPATHAIRFARVMVFSLLGNAAISAMLTGTVPINRTLIGAAVISAAETAYRLVWPTPEASPLEPSAGVERG